MKESELDKMFNIVGLSKDKLFSALREMGPSHVKPEYRASWSMEKPTVGYCYVVSEVIYHFLASEGTKSYKLKTPEGSHWVLKYPNGETIDLTADQIEGQYNYDEAVERRFRTSKISKRGKILAKKMNLI